jgi:hypothetical protein
MLSDANKDGCVVGNDYIIMAQEWGRVKGPSGINNPGRNFDDCPDSVLGDGHGCVTCP